MVEALQNTIDTLQAIREDLPALIAECLHELEPVIRRMNEEQLDKGLRSDGSQLPDYSPVSVAKFGKTPGPMNLKKTGAFRGKISVKVNPTFAEIIGLDSKTGKLEALYELTIIGVPDDRMEELIFDHLLPLLQEKVQTKYFA